MAGQCAVPSRRRDQSTAPRDEGEHLVQLEPLAPDEAAALFTIRAREVRQAGDARDADLLRELMVLLDHLPLAIELAAARTRLLSLRRIVDRMSDRFKLLADGTTGVSASTLQATIAWSWDLASPWERATLAQLAIFEGLHLEDVEAVVDLSPSQTRPGPWMSSPRWLISHWSRGQRRSICLAHIGPGLRAHEAR